MQEYSDIPETKIMLCKHESIHQVKQVNVSAIKKNERNHNKRTHVPTQTFCPQGSIDIILTSRGQQLTWIIFVHTYSPQL